MSPEVHLVQEIEKYECLYNSNLPEYNRKDVTDDAWAHVSYATNLTITECKEKWRNIRSSLLRSLKPSEKAKKPYYLTSYLTFVLPFMKPLNGLEYKEEIYNATSIGVTPKDSDILICTVKSEETAHTILSDALNSELRNDDPDPDPLFQPESPVNHKRKRTEPTFIRKKKSEDGDALIGEQIYTLTQEPPRTNLESMHYFLMSLLPEFETMSEEQTRMFKIKVMMLIDNIKSNFDKLQSTVSSADDSNRIQKRLINLLLRNLEKKT